MSYSDLPQTEVLMREIPKNPSRESLEDDSIGIIPLPELMDLFLIRKKTQYTTSPADLMLLVGSNASQIVELETSVGTSLMKAGSDIVLAMRSIQGAGIPVIAINQHPEGVNFSNKFSDDGVDLKLQTINRLHLHLFVEEGEGIPYLSLSQMESLDRKDFYDPFGIIMSEALIDNIQVILDCSGLNSKIEINLSDFPIGLRFKYVEGIEKLLSNPKYFETLKSIQLLYLNFYYYIKQLFTTSDGEIIDRNKRINEYKELIKSYSISERSRKYGYIGISNLKSSEQKKHLRLVQGPALTWIISGKGSYTSTDLIFRVISRGNASESLGIWVEPTGEATQERLDRLNLFYVQLLYKLRQKNYIKTGPLIY